MSDRAKIVAGLVVFLAIVAFPVWYPLGASGDTARPELELPEGETSCVEPTEYMTANHMDLLNQWRNAVVRDGETEYLSSTGERYVMSLTGTCLDCHGARDTFCNRCHDYANVVPRCFDCHIEPEGG
jgi:hypothetical protein